MCNASIFNQIKEAILDAQPKVKEANDNLLRANQINIELFDRLDEMAKKLGTAVHENIFCKFCNCTKLDCLCLKKTAQEQSFKKWLEEHQNSHPECSCEHCIASGKKCTKDVCFCGKCNLKKECDCCYCRHNQQLPYVANSTDTPKEECTDCKESCLGVCGKHWLEKHCESNKECLCTYCLNSGKRCTKDICFCSNCKKSEPKEKLYRIKPLKWIDEFSAISFDGETFKIKVINETFRDVLFFYTSVSYRVERDNSELIPIFSTHEDAKKYCEKIYVLKINPYLEEVEND